MPVGNSCSHSMRWIDALDSAGKNCKHFGMLYASNLTDPTQNLQYLISSQKLPLSQKVRKLLKGGLNVLNVALFKFILWKRKKLNATKIDPFAVFSTFGMDQVP